MKVYIIIPASGTGSRFGGNTPKQFLPLEGKSILWRTISAFEKMDAVDEIIIATAEEYIHEVKNYSFAKARHVIKGGESRSASIYEAIKILQAAPQDIILIHDGARPFVTAETITAVISAAAKHGAAISCTPMTDTIKEVNEDGRITATPNRANLWRAQTPQGFTYEIISKAYKQGEEDEILHTVTDDSALAERMGTPVFVVPSPPGNIKITTPEDMKIAEAFMKNITIYTDGACSGNPGPGGYGAVLIYGNHRKEFSGYEAETTNNRMEIMGVITALEALKEPCTVALYSDSRYVVDAIEKGWAKRWRSNNWMRNKKEQALNPDLWEELLILLEKHTVSCRWVKGHASNPENERCDELARSAIANATN